MSLHDLIASTVACVKCGTVGMGKCKCWVQCACGWMKERGADGCSRCMSVEWRRVQPGRYEATIGSFRLSTWRDPPHWSFSVTDPDGAVWRPGYLMGTNKGAKSYALARAWKLGAESPPAILTYTCSRAGGPG